MQQHWEGYITALGSQKTPQTSMPNIAPYETSSYETGKTGFMDLLVTPVQKSIQARYDAMSGSWEGVKASEANTSLFKTENAQINKQNYGKK